MQNNETTNRKSNRRAREDKFLVAAIVLPIVIIFLIGGGAALWKGLVTVMKVIVPNAWVVLVYIYVAIVAFWIGKRF